MNRLVILLFPVVLMILSAAGQVPSVEFKVKEKSGFLGIGPPRFMSLSMSNADRQLPLTSHNVNAHAQYYFLIRPVGGWLPDAGFVKDDVPKLSLYQNQKEFPILSRSEMLLADSSILLGFSKELKINEQFLVQFRIDQLVNQIEFKVPMELWPGYATFDRLTTKASTEYSSGAFRAAIATYATALKNDSLKIFPGYAELKDQRSRVFESFLARHESALYGSAGDVMLDLKQRIRAVDSLRPFIQYVVDSLPDPSLGITPFEPGASLIYDRARQILQTSRATRDSLQDILDDQNVRWILDGGSGARTGYLYQHMIETLAYAFSSVDFLDTASTTLVFTIPQELHARLVKYNLYESYETFTRLSNERFARRNPLFSFEFLPNVLKDSASFTQPYYSMLKAVEDYFFGRYDAALKEIFLIFRTCSEPLLTERFDEMRAMIEVRRTKRYADVVAILREARKTEEGGQTEAAFEKYRQANTIAPDFAFSSYRWGKYYSRIGDPIRAITFFQRAYQLDTLHLSAYREAFDLYRRGGNYKPMIEVLNTALRYGNQYWEIFFNLGLAYLGDGDPARAIQHFEKALTINPHNYETNIQLGLAYQNARNYQKAREYFNNAINIDPLRQAAVDYLMKLNEIQRSGR
ncbi:MAG: tetratricopeptide repeat protein [Ignavibacteria bacterium]|nr:tetratricopeptide repeat protein [Ignavibacteria bacterium]